MDLDLLTAVYLIVGGFVAGFINAVAGGGSAITLPLLVEFLGDAGVANGTNRIAILLQNLSGVTRFQRSKKVPWAEIRPLFIPTIIGAVAGAAVAVRIDPLILKRVFGVVILLVALSVLLNPSKWADDERNRLQEPWRSLVYLGIGFYGGFVQAGVGFLFITSLIMFGGMNLVTGNAAKLTLIASYTVLALATFVWAGQVHLLAGLVLSIGTMAGAWVSAHVAVAKGSAWVRWMLVVAAVVAAGRMLLT